MRPGVAGNRPSTDMDFGQTVMHCPENIERQKEKDRGSVEIKLRHHLVTELRLINGIGTNFRVVAIVL